MTDATIRSERPHHDASARACDVHHAMSMHQVGAMDQMVMHQWATWLCIQWAMAMHPMGHTAMNNGPHGHEPDASNGHATCKHAPRVDGARKHASCRCTRASGSVQGRADRHNTTPDTTPEATLSDVKGTARNRSRSHRLRSLIRN